MKEIPQWEKQGQEIGPDDVIARIQQMAEGANASWPDDEQLHAVEDSLWAEVLQSIAQGRCTDPAACAREALKSCKIDFCRWYA